MKAYIITIDCGTTNTRVTLLNKEFGFVGLEKREVGVRNTAIDGNNNCLKQALRECINSLLMQEKIGFEHIVKIVATGMITSNMGLKEIAHLVVPVGIADLAKSMETVLIEDVCPLPISFVPGVKNNNENIDIYSIENMDMMRGEEVECCALIKELHVGKPLLIVLPGSHTKFVSVDAQGFITGCLSSIAGELLAAITNYTIIADAVGKSFVADSDYDKTVLLAGYAQAKETGLGRACFSTRILNQFVSKDTSKAANFLLGAVLEGDIKAIKNSKAICVGPDTTVVVTGKSPLRNALFDILQFEDYFQEVKMYFTDEDISLSTKGVIALIKH